MFFLEEMSLSFGYMCMFFILKRYLLRSVYTCWDWCKMRQSRGKIGVNGVCFCRTYISLGGKY